MEQILALLMALTAPEADTTRFRHLIDGGLSGQAAVRIEPCPRPLATTEIERETIVCGTVKVPEDHAAPDNGRNIDLFFTVMAAHSSYPRADPVVYLHGGPGAGTILGSLAALARYFDVFRDTRDVVMFDQRAAGLSASSVQCYDAIVENAATIAVQAAQKNIRSIELGEDGKPRLVQLYADCVEEIRSSGRDLSAYNTVQNAQDVPTVLRALGYDTWNIYGISYGTKLALEVMRTAPEGTRSVVLDGVAPPWIQTYDTLGVPLHESVLRLIADCEAEKACATAYPDLRTVVPDVVSKNMAGELTLEGETLPPGLTLMPFLERNKLEHEVSLTPYIPALMYEFHRGDDDAPTIELIYKRHEFDLPPPDADAVASARQDILTEAQQTSLSLALRDAEIIGAAQRSLDVAVSQLRQQIVRERELGPLPSLFDSELSAATPDTITSPEAAAAAINDYAALEIGEPSRERLSGFVTANFKGPHEARLLSIVTAMTEAEVANTFAFIRSTVGKHTGKFQGNANLWIYACQEDVPFNTMEQYQALNASLEIPAVAAVYDATAVGFYTACETFDQVHHPGYHEVVESGIPTVSIGGGWDIQTAASWAEAATEGLTNARHFFMAETGHGSLVFAPCVGELTRAFFDDPARELDDGCEKETAVPKFHIAPWVAAEDPAGAQ